MLRISSIAARISNAGAASTNVVPVYSAINAAMPMGRIVTRGVSIGGSMMTGVSGMSRFSTRVGFDATRFAHMQSLGATRAKLNSSTMMFMMSPRAWFTSVGRPLMQRLSRDAQVARARGGGYYNYGNRGTGLTDQQLLWVLLGSNAAVWGLWVILEPRIMYKHFTLSLPGVLRGYVHTIVTHMFSHVSLTHLGMNMITLYFFAPACMAAIGQRRFLGLYFVSGLLSALGSLAWDMQDAKRGQYRSHFYLGASGALNGIVMYMVCRNPWAQFMIYMVLPVPAIIAGTAFVAWDIWGAYRGDGSVGHIGHLGGALAGVAYFMATRGRF